MVKLFPAYEPPSAADKISRLGNMTISGRNETVNFTVSIRAIRGGHVTVYWNASPPEIV